MSAVAPIDMTPQRIPRSEAMEMTVAEVMITNPKTLPADAHVADVRAAFARSSIRTVLLADKGRFRGAVERDHVPSDAAGDQPATRYADIDPLTATPAMPMSEAIQLLEVRGEPRLIVLDTDGVTLRGLLCFNPGSSGFCVR